MQILQTAGDIAGARGWLWRVETVESAGRRRAALLHLTRDHRAGTARLTAVRRIEPIARVAAANTIAPAPCAEAIALAVHAARAARRAFTLPAVERLNGEVHAWQLAAALAFERGHSRVLLADPAGMGKTVSAAIAIAQCLDADPGARCLVLCPGHLVLQWRDELRRRLAIDAQVIDAPGLRHLLCEIPAGLSPWAPSGCRIASLDFVKQPHVARGLEAEVLDLLVIDEAHLACGVSDRHAACDMLARRARRLLLLTATPSDGGADRMRALMSLGAAGDSIVTLRHPQAPESLRAVARTVCLPPHPSVAALHDALGQYAQWIALGPRRGAPDVALLASLLVKRALSSAHAARISLERRLALLGELPPIAQPGLFDPEDDAGVIGAASGRPAGDERAHLAVLVGLAADAERSDERVAHLERLLRRAEEPAVIFSCFRDTAQHIASRLSRWCDTRLVHGQLPHATIEANLAAFVDGPARLLVATDVASQGLNLHARCRWIIHYDLPWRPSTIRQRNGRVDRLGQTRRPHATCLIDRTPLSLGMVRDAAALGERMRADESASPRRWQALAGAEARRIEGLRAASPLPASPGGSRAPRGDVTVVEIDLVDKEGASLDRRVAALDAGEAAAHAWAHRAAARRARALGPRFDAAAARRQARERAVAGAASESIASTLVQHGLFERRAERNRAAATSLRGALAGAARAAIRRHTTRARIVRARVRTIATFAFCKEEETPQR